MKRFSEEDIGHILSTLTDPSTKSAVRSGLFWKFFWGAYGTATVVAATIIAVVGLGGLTVVSRHMGKASDETLDTVDSIDPIFLPTSLEDMQIDISEETLLPRYGATTEVEINGMGDIEADSNTIDMLPRYGATTAVEINGMGDVEADSDTIGMFQNTAKELIPNEDMTITEQKMVPDRVNDAQADEVAEFEIDHGLQVQ